MATDSGEVRNGLRVLVADEDRAALEATGKVLEDLGHEVTACAVDLAEASEAIAREDPELAVVVVHEDDEHALRLIEEISSFSRGPVIALLGSEDPGFVRAAAECGIAAYARPLTHETVQGAIEVALRRHAETRQLDEKVEQLQTALERRAVIERAKGIVMERHSVNERDAFELLRGHARSRSLSVLAIASAVADGHALLPGGNGAD